LLEANEGNEQLRTAIRWDMQAQAKREAELERVFLRDPATWLRHETNSVDWHVQVDALAVLTHHQNDRIREAACEYMRKAFPLERASPCGSALQ
jgi:hypothetical protein